MRRYRPRCVGSQEQRGKGVYGISAPGTDSGNGWTAYYRGGCPQGVQSGRSHRLSERLPCGSEGYDVSQTPGDKLYFNLFADEICNAATDDADCVKGELAFRGKVGQNIEEKRDKKDQPYTVFSAFSAEKVDDGFEYQWVRFFCFGKERDAWLQPGIKVDAIGEMNLSAHNGKINLSCKVEELTQYVADSSNYNQ